MLKAQVSFFAITGLFIVIIAAVMLATTSKTATIMFKEEAARQAALNEDRIMLEWYMDELIRTAMLESINGSGIVGIGELEEAVEEKIDSLFDNEQFNRRGADVLRGNSSVKLKIAEKEIIADVDYTVKLQRSFGETKISERSVKVGYNLQRAYRFAAQVEEDGEYEFEGAKFVVEGSVIKDYSMFLKGEPIEFVLT